MNLPLIILAAGGHAKVLLATLQLESAEVLGIVDPNPGIAGGELFGVPILGDDEAAMKYHPEAVRLVNGVGSVDVSPARSQIFERFRNKGFCFAKVIHPAAILATDITLSEGVQVMAGAIIQPGAYLGMNVIINTGAVVEHDCQIGDHVHIAPRATLSGGVKVGAGTHVGTGATVIQGINIGRNCLIAAGAVVVRDVPDNAAVCGVPAKERGGQL